MACLLPIIVLCDCYKPDPDAPMGVGAPIPTNTRVACNKIMEAVKDTEPWFGIRYRQESVASEDYAQWVAAYDAGRTAGLAAATRGAATAGESGTAGDKLVELASQFHLPTRNKFIPTDFALRGAPAPAAAEPSAAAVPSARCPLSLARRVHMRPTP